MKDTTTHGRISGLRPLHGLRHLVTLFTVAVAALVVPVGAASARIEPGPEPSSVAYQMPATPVSDAPAASTAWGTYVVVLLAVVGIVAVSLAVWAMVRRNHASSPAALGA